MQKISLTIQAQAEPLLIARLAIACRKYSLEIRDLHVESSFDAQMISIRMVVLAQKENTVVAMKKLRRLVPIVDLEYAVAA